MNVHNPYIRKWNQTYYLYYMGTTFGGPIPAPVTRWTARVLPKSGTANESVLQPHRLFLVHGRGAMSR